MARGETDTTDPPAVASRVGAAAHRTLDALALVAVALLPVQGLRPHDRVTASDLVLVVAAAVAVFSRGNRPLRTWVRGWLLLGLALMAVGGLVGLVRAEQLAHSAGLLARLAGVVVLGLWVVGRWDPGPERARTALSAYVLVAAASAALGVVAAATGVDALSSLENGVGRAQGLGANANLFGAVTAVALGVGVVLAATTRSARRWWWLVPLVVLAAGIAWSGSRSAVLGAAAGALGLAVHLGRRRPRLLAGVAVVLVVSAGVAALGIVRVPAVDRFLLRTDSAASERSAESTEVRAGQLTRGLDERGELSLLTGSGLRDDNPTALHNGHLEVWLGLGLLGAAGWVLVVARTARPAAGLALGSRPLERAGAPLLAASSGFVAYAVCAAFVDNVWNRYIWVLVALVAVLEQGRADAPAALGDAEGRDERAGEDRTGGDGAVG